MAQQQPTVRSFPVYYNSKKIATAFEKTYKLMSGRTKLFGSDGYLCHSKGAATTSLQINMVIPQRGVDVNWLEDLLNQEDVMIGVPVGGRYIQQPMAITEGTMKANTEKGTCEGDCTFEGGKPDLAA